MGFIDDTLCFHQTWQWKIPELNGGLIGESYFYGPFSGKCLITGGYVVARGSADLERLPDDHLIESRCMDSYPYSFLIGLI